MSETPFQECQRIIRELRAELVEKDKLYVREMAKVATREAEIERLQEQVAALLEGAQEDDAEIERLRAERAGDQHRLFHYEAEIERLQAICDPIISALKSAEAEIERLKAALADVAGTNHYKMQEEIERLRAWHYLISHWPEDGELRDMARSALRGEPAPRAKAGSER
jgi:chromosome segregation ATPase